MIMQTLVNALPALQKLGKQDLPLKTLYKVSCVLKKLDENLDFYNKQRRELTLKYCTKRDNKYFPKEGCKEEYNAKLTELLELEVEMGIEVPVVISPNENITLSYNDLVALEKFIKIDFVEGEAGNTRS
jgi:hypothetical protein